MYSVLHFFTNCKFTFILMWITFDSSELCSSSSSIGSILPAIRNIRSHSQSKWINWMPLFQEVCSAVSCTFSPSTCNFLDLIFNFNSLKSLLIQIPPLLDQQEISTEHYQTDLLLDQLLQIQHLSPLACWQHVVQDLGGEKNENEDQTGGLWPKCY